MPTACPAPGALRGAGGEDAGHVGLRLRPLLQTRHHRRGEDPHEHHRPGPAHRGVEGPGERGEGGGAPSLTKLHHHGGKEL